MTIKTQVVSLSFTITNKRFQKAQSTTPDTYVKSRSPDRIPSGRGTLGGVTNIKGDFTFAYITVCIVSSVDGNKLPFSLPLFFSVFCAAY
jgi:hypothetical protein